MPKHPLPEQRVDSATAAALAWPPFSLQAGPLNIIGLSGLHHSIPFKKREYPGLSARDYRAVHGVDSAAALVNRTGIVAAVAEERFNRDKGSCHFPVESIRYCLKAAGLVPADIDFVAHGFDYAPVRDVFQATPEMRKLYDEVYGPEVQEKLLREFLPEFGWEKKLVRVPHHLAHAASAFYVSGFERSLILVADGMGEAHNTTVLLGTPEGMKILAQNAGFHSLGILYGLFTLYLGFMMGMDEYKVMGLAPYGDRNKHKEKILQLVKFRPDAGFSVPLVYRNRTTAEAQTNAGVIAALTEMFGPAREPESELLPHHMDLAASLQAALEECLLRILRHHAERTGEKNLCMAGGVALNCTANGLIRRSGLFEEVFVQPAAGDDGTALGAALYLQREKDRQAAPRKMGLPLWGPGFTTDEVRQAVAEMPAELEAEEIADDDVLADRVSAALVDQKIVAWFQGRMEYGPRALGSRSILADPRDPTMRDRVNRIVKKREEFRPFAPVVKAEEASRYFEIRPGDEETYAHMLFITDVKPEWRAKLPAITHVNGSARVQTLTNEAQPRLARVLDAFKKRSGIGMLLNTSFNVRGQPIVCTPAEALDTFNRYNLDVLVIDRFLVRRKAGAAAA